MVKNRNKKSGNKFKSQIEEKKKKTNWKKFKLFGKVKGLR